MTIPQLTRITNDREYIDSLEVVDRIAILEQYQFAADLDEEGEGLPEEEAEELTALVDLELQCKSRTPDSWKSGTTLVRHDAPGWPICCSEFVDFCGVTYALQVG